MHIKNYFQNFKLLLPCQIGKGILSKSNFLCEVERKKNRFSKQLLTAIFYKTFGFLPDINTQDQAQISSMDTDANSKENQIDPANKQNKLKIENRAVADLGF